MIILFFIPMYSKFYEYSNNLPNLKLIINYVNYKHNMMNHYQVAISRVGFKYNVTIPNILKMIYEYNICQYEQHYDTIVKNEWNYVMKSSYCLVNNINMYK